MAGPIKITIDIVNNREHIGEERQLTLVKNNSLSAKQCAKFYSLTNDNFMLNFILLLEVIIKKVLRRLRELLEVIHVASSFCFGIYTIYYGGHIDPDMEREATSLLIKRPLSRVVKN